ncbi:hypothetical protein FE257_008539 [Aspergillus nanangensis]|uniref:N-acetyltransferase domain-containing protein n=1 Tax=Aspergillus nanangensis TaxID=2582783 RepID=A0AAD4CLM6_ASPNN|nr:hypothetical protein FE257_008539 [Aspergillus nanangensis]
MSSTTQFPSLPGLNAFLRPLSVSDTKSCTTVESAFPEHERCSEEKFIYRLNQTPELCLGLFIKAKDNERLIGHVIANRTSFKTATDGSMLMPESWRSLAPHDVSLCEGEIIGNDPAGGTVAIHSVAISPEYQGKGVGRALVKAYVQYIREANVVADRIVLIAHGHLIGFYEAAGFHNFGPSPCQFAGGGWFDMVILLDPN